MHAGHLAFALNAKTGDAFCIYLGKTLKPQSSFQVSSKMDPSQFRGAFPGTLVRTINDQMAYVPHPLPPELDSSRLLVPLADAINAIGELRGAARRLANPNI